MQILYLPTLLIDCVPRYLYFLAWFYVKQTVVGTYLLTVSTISRYRYLLFYRSIALKNARMVGRYIFDLFVPTIFTYL